MNKIRMKNGLVIFSLIYHIKIVVCMAVNLIMRFMISMFALGLGMFIFMPVLYALAYDVNLWTGLPASVLQTRDYVYSILMAMPLIAFGALILWGYMKATTQDPYEQYR